MLDSQGSNCRTRLVSISILTIAHAASWLPVADKPAGSGTDRKRRVVEQFEMTFCLPCDWIRDRLAAGDRVPLSGTAPPFYPSRLELETRSNPLPRFLYKVINYHYAKRALFYREIISRSASARAFKIPYVS